MLSPDDVPQRADSRGEVNPAFAGGCNDEELRDEIQPLPPPQYRRKKSSFLTIDHAELNVHTYVYDSNRSLQKMTMEVLPSERAYQNLGELYEDNHRPTLEELAAGRKANIPGLSESKDVDAGDGGETKLKGKVVKFGWLDGVYMRCLLNIWGVMLFLRLTWIVGQCGIFQGLAVLTLANIVTLITALSMSAVSTNGQIRAGGIYYMISRSLGPEFGGAIGIMFTLANSIAVALYLIGFCDSLLDMLYAYVNDFSGIVGTADLRLNDVRLIGLIALVLILGLAIVGMDWVTRVQIVLLALLLVSQADFLAGSFLANKESDKAKYGIVGYNATLFEQNLYPDYHDYKHPDFTPNFFSVFGVFFPAVTGIVAGANLSGDLKDPATAIPKGTILAIVTTFVTYVGYAFVIAATTVTNASGNQTEYEAWRDGVYPEGVVDFTNCSLEVRGEDICIYGSANDQQTMAKISYTEYLIFAGCFAATLSSAIASLVGAPRVLQALAKDNLYPLIGVFGEGYGANNDPFRGYVLVFIIAAGCIAIGQLDVVSVLLSNFFVAAYALINFSVFHATITKSPGWRPSFKYYNHWVSLLGTILCVVVMFMMDWITALITFASVAILYFYISYRKPDANWGSSTQAQQFVTTLGNVQNLSDVPDHVKNYRPKVLVFSGVPAHRQPLVDFGYLITKKLSLMICADVETGEGSQTHLEVLRKNVNLWLKDHEIKAFFSACHNDTFAKGALSCMDLVGLGKLTPNMVLLGFKGNWQGDVQGLQDYLEVINHAFGEQMAVGVLRLSGGCDYSNVVGKEDHLIIETETKDKKKDEPCLDVGNKGEALKPSKDTVVGKKPIKKVPVTVYHGVDGNPLSGDIVAEITKFQGTKLKGTIDVWWLYDDGGLTLLLPYILTTRSKFSECSLRVFTLANRRDELDRETRNMITLLAKFRIDYSDVTVIPDVTKKAKDATKAEFTKVLEGIDGDKPSEIELTTNREKTNRHLRLTELLRENSAKSEMVIMTLPMPRRGVTPSTLYMSWLEMMTRQMPPFLLVRGNQTSVLTFYS